MLMERSQRRERGGVPLRPNSGLLEFGYKRGGDDVAPSVGAWRCEEAELR